VGGWKTNNNSFSTTESVIWRNAGTSAQCTSVAEDLCFKKVTKYGAHMLRLTVSAYVLFE